MIICICNPRNPYTVLQLCLYDQISQPSPVGHKLELSNSLISSNSTSIWRVFLVLKVGSMKKLVSVKEISFTWWRHQMETFSALLALCAGNSPVTGEFPTQRPVTRSFAFFSLIYAWINGWVSNREAGDLRRHHAYYDVIVMKFALVNKIWICISQMFHGISMPCQTRHKELQSSIIYNISYEIQTHTHIYIYIYMWVMGYPQKNHF